MSSNRIVFKGINDGIYIKTKIDNFKELQDGLKKLLDERPNFYKGAKLLGVINDYLDPMEIIELSFMLKYNYGFEIDYDELNEIIKEKFKEKKQKIEQVEQVKAEQAKAELKVKNKEKPLTKFLNKTIRSGQVIRHSGNLVIIGDVNSGALVEAGGNIIVLGSFRGVGHAGKNGDKDAIVASYNLSPTQLRIADKIARSPDRNPTNNDRVIPEIAKIMNDELIIVPYLTNK